MSEETIQLNIRVPREMARWIRRIAVEREISQGQLVAEAVDAFRGCNCEGEFSVNPRDHSTICRFVHGRGR